MTVLDRIIPVSNFEGQYVQETTEKTQIVLHHTVSGNGVNGDLSWWKQTKQRIATAIIIDRDGTPYQCFSTRYWAYHIGPVSKQFTKLHEPYRKCDPNSIGVELDSWGALLKHKGKYYPVKWNKEQARYVPWIEAGEVKNVSNSNHRGFSYYEKYTDAQINTLRELLLYWNDYWGIPLDYDDKIWDVNRDALIGTPGIYSHVSYRDDKSDCHPQKELIDMLKYLK